MSNNKIKILWVRHCESCANISKINLNNKLFKEPLCTKKGIIQAYLFGKYLAEKYKNHKIKFYSSVLPRAIETAKIASIGYDENIENNKNNLDNEIQRLYKCQEISNLLENINVLNKNGSSNITTIKKSNCHSIAINRIFKSRVNITEDIFPFQFKINNKEILKYSDKDYSIFKKDILPNLDNSINKINVIFTHGMYIRKNVLKELNLNTIKTNNLEAYLIEYDLNTLENELIGFISTPSLSSLPTLLNPNKQELNMFNENLINNIIDKEIVNCKYTYHKNIKPYCK